MPAINFWSNSATLISRRLEPSRRANRLSVKDKASGPNLSGPNVLLSWPAVKSRTLPNPRRSQKRISAGFTSSSRKRNRRCSTFGGSAINTNPVIRGSNTIASRLSNRTTTRLPNRSIESIVRPTTRRRNEARPGEMAIGRRRHGGRSRPMIFPPTVARIPRRMVSTSGSSGIIDP